MRSGTPVSTGPPGDPTYNDNGSPPGKDAAGNNSSETPVIAGAVAVSIGGIILILLSFFLGRRYAAKERTPETSSTTSRPGYDGSRSWRAPPRNHMLHRQRSSLPTRWPGTCCLPRWELTSFLGRRVTPTTTKPNPAKMRR
ncbi:hypothetical protein C8A03DRAFT_39095 [Achaetomium macrosporum]|uniref:Uncharacterized protein n=1 Tax=Achaetomium macrosporum TaxID=79813 RepID=A0AAN7C0W4_9PEZI|nr:hypothetical protein C8A03DRAFT_39095 [Achaetomium macrosporum]